MIQSNRKIIFLSFKIDKEMKLIILVCLCVILFNFVGHLNAQNIYGNTCTCIGVVCGSSGQPNGNACWYNCCWMTMSKNN